MITAITSPSPSSALSHDVPDAAFRLSHKSTAITASVAAPTASPISVLMPTDTAGALGVVGMERGLMGSQSSSVALVCCTIPLRRLGCTPRSGSRFPGAVLDAAESPFPAREIAKGFLELVLAELRPKRVRNVNLRV